MTKYIKSLALDTSINTTASVCFSAKKTKSWYWSSSRARILNVQAIIKERTKKTSSNISSTCIPSTTIAGAGKHSFNTCLRRTWYWECRPAYPPNSGSMMGQRCSPLPVQCRSIVYDAGPTLIYHRDCCILCANTWHSTNAVSMLTHSLRRWPVIETASGNCTVFFYCCIILVTLYISAPETPDNTIHWPNADVSWATVCDAGPTLFQPKPFELLITNIIVNIFFLNTCWRQKYLTYCTCS